MCTRFLGFPTIRRAPPIQRPTLMCLRGHLPPRPGLPGERTRPRDLYGASLSSISAHSAELGRPAARDIIIISND